MTATRAQRRTLAELVTVCANTIVGVVMVDPEVRLTRRDLADLSGLTVSQVDDALRVLRGVGAVKWLPVGPGPQVLTANTTLLAGFVSPDSDPPTPQ